MRLVIPMVAVIVAFLIGGIYPLWTAAEDTKRPDLEKTAESADPNGLVIYWVGDFPIEMKEGDDFGVLLANPGWEENPQPRYILGIAASRTLVDTQDLEVFKLALGKIPRGSAVHRYGTCTVPRSWGLKAEQIEEFQKSIEEAGLVWAEGRLVCYCESLN